METNTQMLHVWSSSFAPWLGQCYWIVQTCAWNIWDTLWTFKLCSWVYHTHEISTAAAHFSRRRDFGVTKPGITTPSWSFRAIHLEDLGCCPNAVRCCPSLCVWLKFKTDKTEKLHWGKGSTKKICPTHITSSGGHPLFPSHAKYQVRDMQSISSLAKSAAFDEINVFTDLTGFPISVRYMVLLNIDEHCTFWLISSQCYNRNNAKSKESSWSNHIV